MIANRHTQPRILKRQGRPHEAGEEKFPPCEILHCTISPYDSDGFQVPNTLNRFAISRWMTFADNPDGSLDLYFQNESLGKDKEANWLPAPQGPFNLAMRLCSPKPEALTGKWNPPAIRKTDAAPLLAQ